MHRSAAILGVAVMTTAAVGGATMVHAAPSTTHHTLHFTSRSLHSTLLGKTKQVGTDRVLASGKTVGYDVTDCSFNFTTNIANCAVSAALQRGVLYARIAINGPNGSGHGKVVGGTGAFKGARGTVTSTPGSRKSDTSVTIVYHR